MEILYQDEDLIIVNKPSGLLTIRDGYNPNLPSVKSLLDTEFGRCWIVHRLDKETSGALIVALNEKVHRFLNLAFQNRQIRKKYHAIVLGTPGEPKFVIDSPLRVNGDRNHRTVIDAILGKPAKSIVTVISSYSNSSLVMIEPETGYTHQIRAHLAHFGFPILGDRLYQCRDQITNPANSLIHRTALHASQISLLHPKTDQPLIINSTFPADFSSVIAVLTKK